MQLAELIFTELGIFKAAISWNTFDLPYALPFLFHLLSFFNLIPYLTPHVLFSIFFLSLRFVRHLNIHNRKRLLPGCCEINTYGQTENKIIQFNWTSYPETSVLNGCEEREIPKMKFNHQFFDDR